MLSVFSFILALSIGSVSFSFVKIMTSIFDDTPSVLQTIVWELRAPRAYTAFVTGGLLALAGVIMQVLLRNPLAEPYILGVSGGASVGALSIMYIGLAGSWVSGGAFVGAFVSILIVFSLAQGKGCWNPGRLLLTGVVLAAGWGAVINFILSLSPDQNIKGMLFWLMGDIHYSSIDISVLLVLLLGSSICFVLSRQLNILTRGDLQAHALGVPVKPLRIGLFLLASLLTAFAVIQAGSVGFVGLVVPHMIRLVSTSDHRLLVPASVLLGGSLLLVSDTLARTIIAPQQLPVGVITALIGVPFFLVLLNKNFGKSL